MNDSTQIFHRIGIHRGNWPSHAPDTRTHDRQRGDGVHFPHHREPVNQPLYEADIGTPDRDLCCNDLRGPSPSRAGTTHHGSHTSRHQNDDTHHTVATSLPGSI